MYKIKEDQQLVRFPIPENKISWDVQFPGYNPVNYSVVNEHTDPVRGDNKVKELQFNKVEETQVKT